MSLFNNSKLQETINEVVAQKEEALQMLSEKDATIANLTEAKEELLAELESLSDYKNMIENLQGDIEALNYEVGQLKKENEALKKENTELKDSSSKMVEALENPAQAVADAVDGQEKPIALDNLDEEEMTWEKAIKEYGYVKARVKFPNLFMKAYPAFNKTNK